MEPDSKSTNMQCVSRGDDSGAFCRVSGLSSLTVYIYFLDHGLDCFERVVRKTWRMK